MSILTTSVILLLLLSIHPSDAFTCSVSSCSYFGGRATCCPSTPCLPVACAVWHATQSPFICRFPCPSTCSPPSLRPIATDAIAYCNNCTLARASCHYGFDIYGPIDQGVAFAVDVEPTPHETPTPMLSSPSPSHSPSPYQSPDSFFDTDFPEDSPDIADLTAEPSVEETSFMDPTPLPVITPTCSVEFCTQFGARAECSSSSDQALTCLDWSAQGGTRGCPIVCTSRCNLGLSAPLASDGRRYCSLCHLRLISCLTGFFITGPVPSVESNEISQPMPIDDPVQVIY